MTKTRSAQVRLDDDVRDLLLTHDGSLSNAANAILRPALGLGPKPRTRRDPHYKHFPNAVPAGRIDVLPPPVVQTPAPVVERPVARPTNARVGRARGRCPHPITRRIGTVCAACGREV